MVTIPWQLIFSGVIQIVVPLFFFGWLVFAKTPPSVFKVAVLALLALYLLFIGRAGAWHIFGRFWSDLFFILYFVSLVAVLLGVKRVDFNLDYDFKSWINLAALVAAFLLFLLWRMPQLYYYARSVPDSAVELAFPLHGGEFLVTQGGNTSALNHHFGNRAQKFALDIVETDRFGFRASALLPSELTQYAIFDRPVYAPCRGTVIALNNRLPDLMPPETDQEHAAGNHVVLSCRGYSILIAHLRQGSVAVSVGQELAEGTLIGRVGNSGNSSEPHLHIHAVKGISASVADITQSAEAAPMLFDSRFLIRNDRFSRL